MKETMTYFYNYEDLPEVVENEDGTYTVDGKTFADGSVNTPENIVAEIDRRIALLHYVQDDDEYEDDEFDAPPNPVREMIDAALGLAYSAVPALRWL